MNLLFAGHSAFDTVLQNDEKKYSPGGIYYNVIGVTGCSTSEDNISILTGIDDKYKWFAPLYDRYDRSLSPEIKSGVRVELTIHPDKEREERYLAMPEPLPLPENERLTNFDGILFNFISGNDFKLEDIKRVRAEYKGIMYADLHTLTRGMDEQGRRYFRKLPSRQEWLNCFDIIQVNDTELESIKIFPAQSESIREILSAGVKVLIVTYGAKGAAVYYRKNEEVEYSFISIKRISTRGCVGCGDIFGAFFFYYYVLNGNVFSALEEATVVSENFASIESGKSIDFIINKLKRE